MGVQIGTIIRKGNLAICIKKSLNVYNNSLEIMGICLKKTMINIMQKVSYKVPII